MVTATEGMEMVRHRMLLVWALGFAGGIGVQALAGGEIGLWLWAPLAVLGLSLVGFCGRHWALGLLGVALAGLGAGAVRLGVSQAIRVSDVSRSAGQVAPVTLTGTVVSDPEARRGGRVTLFLQAERATQFGTSQAVTGDVSVTLPVGSPDVEYGDRLTLHGRLDQPPGATNPGAFSWRDYLSRRGVYCELGVKRPGAVYRIGGSTLNPALHLAWTVRRRVLRVVRANLPATQAAVLSGILLGSRTDLDPDLMADFVHTGTVHILASAGLHVGVVAFWALWLCERLTLPRKVSAGCVIGTLWLYALMAGGRPSVTRAVIMATVYFGALLFEREPDLPTTLAAAALVILLLQPTALLESGFQLSFLTVVTLAMTMPVWDRLWRPRIERCIVRPPVRKAALWAVEMAGLSLLAQAGSFPIVATDYNEVSLSGLAANMLVVPMLFVLIPLGFLGAGLGCLWHGVGNGLLHLAGLGLGYVVAVVRQFGEDAWAYRAVPSPSPLLLICYYAVVYGGTYALSRRLEALAPRPDPAVSGSALLRGRPAP